MASLNNIAVPPLGLNTNFAAEAGVVTLWGSFQPSTGALVQGTANATTSAGFRGNWFTVSRVAAGQYRVQLVGLNAQINTVPVNTLANTNGQPNGLLAEPFAWLVSDGNPTSTTAGGYQTSPANLQVLCSRFDSTGVGSTALAPQTFDIFVTQGTTTTTGGVALLWTAVDCPSTSRIFFEMSYKAVAATP